MIRTPFPEGRSQSVTRNALVAGGVVVVASPDAAQACDRCATTGPLRKRTARKARA